MELSEKIIQKIVMEGPLSFCGFMEAALYDPQMGYYQSYRNQIGKDGDYFTSPSLSPLFGQMIARQIEEMWHLLDEKPFTVVEFGAGAGDLCDDINRHLQQNARLYNAFRYYIVERPEVIRDPEQERSYGGRVVRLDSIRDLRGINGCILTNEVLDNFPVHRVVMQDELMEVFVDFNGEFTEVLRPAPENLKNYLSEQNICLPVNYQTEINLQAIEWIRQIADGLKSGFVITVDYGFGAADLYGPGRHSGTLACYKDQANTGSPYCNIGRQDITAHVNFSALDIWGRKYGLECAGFTTQGHFLRSLGLPELLRSAGSKMNPADSRNYLLQINTLLLNMGSRFKVLVQSKGKTSRNLTGLRLAASAP